MPRGGELTVTVEERDDSVRILIRDTGEGMAKDTMGHAADPFFTTKVVGTGMGLTFVKRIIEDHGGMLSLERGVSGGVQAIITLPKAQ